MPDHRMPWPAVLILFVMGSVGLSNALGRPSLAALRTVDMLQILGSGMCFGVALAFIGFIVRDRS